MAADDDEILLAVAPLLFAFPQAKAAERDRVVGITFLAPTRIFYPKKRDAAQAGGLAARAP